MISISNSVTLENGIVGGIIIGVATSGFLYITGKLSGISSIVEGAFIKVKQGDSWNLYYVLGLISSGYFLQLVNPNLINSTGDIRYTLQANGVVLSGLLVGFGSRLSNGCTSGHGICGLPRLNPRSLVAVLTFMTTGAIAAYIGRDYRVDVSSPAILLSSNDIIKYVAPTISVAIATLLYYKTDFSEFFKIKLVNSAAFASSFLFGIGLGVSGMCNTNKVLSFLDFTNKLGWDYTLMGVMGGGVLFNLISFNLLKKSKPLLNQTVTCSDSLKITNTALDLKLILGAGLFGVGWGLLGVCPGPALVSFGAGRISPFFLPSLMIGMCLQDAVAR